MGARTTVARLQNGSVEVTAPLEFGPRVSGFRFLDGPNLLGDYPGRAAATAWGEWKPYGGHRLWVAPESAGSYAPDSGPIDAIRNRDRLELRQAVDASGIAKAIVVTLAADAPSITLEHSVTNRGCWPIEIAPWALTIMAPGGVAIVPQPEFRSHDDELRPVRAMAIWPFSDFADQRWHHGRRLLTLRPDAARPTPQKIGVANERTWCACVWPDAVFLKRFSWRPHARYPDFGVNNELYAEGEYLEIETLGPLERLDPGATATHVEHWTIFPGLDRAVLSDESALADALASLVQSVAHQGMPA